MTMLRTPWTSLVALLALCLPLFATGCGSSCDDANEICDGCNDENTRSSCKQSVNFCEQVPSTPAYSESDCCDGIIDEYDGEC
jgi:hypothetical protein